MNSDSHSIVFYGAGQNARDNFAKWTNCGIVPVCFVDADNKKWNTRFNPGDLDILPLEAAIAKYPDYRIYITPTREKWADIAKDLVHRGIPLTRIKFFEPVEWRKGCANMGRHFLIHNSIGVCCVPQFSSNLEFEINSDPAKNFKEYENRCSKIIDDWRSGRPSICDGCPDLEFDIWDIEPKIEALNISSKVNADFCNTKCIYCCHYPKPELAAYEKRRREVIDMLETAHKLYPERRFNVIVSGGDIAVAPFRDELFAILKKYGWRADIYSNSAVYCEGVSEQLQDGESTYVTTLDSTIREKFAEIKGVDCLPKVLENIKRYSEAAADKQQIKIKLIVLDGVYSSCDEMSGVVDFAASLGAELMLSCNVVNVKTRLSQAMFDLMVQWMEYAKSKNVFVKIMYDHFNIEDADLLRKQLNI